MDYSASCISKELPVKSKYRIFFSQEKREEMLSLRSLSELPRQGVCREAVF